MHHTVERPSYIPRDQKSLVKKCNWRKNCFFLFIISKRGLGNHCLWMSYTLYTHVHTQTVHLNETSQWRLNRFLTQTSSLSFGVHNTCERRTSSISESPTARWWRRWRGRRWRPGCGTETSSGHVQPPVDVWLLCVSWQTRSRKSPVPAAQWAGLSGWRTESPSALCSWGKSKRTLSKELVDIVKT